MKTELKIPFYLLWKHLQRGNKWSLMLIIFLMSIAFINLIFISSLFAGIIQGANQQVINTASGHVMILPSEDEDVFTAKDEIIEKIKNVNNVKAVSTQMQVAGLLKYKNIKNNWPVVAIDPMLEKEVTNISSMMETGDYLDQKDTNQIIIGKQMAGSEGLEMNALSFQGAQVGEKIILNYGNLSKEFIIKGIFYTKFLETDKKAFITRAAYSEMFPEQEQFATNILIKNNQTGIEAATIQSIKDLNIKGKFYSWEELAGMTSTLNESFFSINVIISIVGVLIAAITIFIVIYIDTTTKKQQVGILRAIGIKSYLIVFSYILQAVVYSMAGILVGTGLFFGIIYVYFQYYPFVLPIGDSHLFVDWKDFIIRLEFFVWICMIAGIVPAVLVVRIKILNAIWGSK